MRESRGEGVYIVGRRLTNEPNDPFIMSRLVEHWAPRRGSCTVVECIFLLGLLRECKANGRGKERNAGVAHCYPGRARNEVGRRRKKKKLSKRGRYKTRRERERERQVKEEEGHTGIIFHASLARSSESKLVQDVRNTV